MTQEELIRFKKQIDAWIARGLKASRNGDLIDVDDNYRLNLKRRVTNRILSKNRKEVWITA